MMKRNKELDEAYTSFIDDLMLFIKETRQLTIEKSKSIDSLESKLNQLMMTPNLKLRTSGKKRSISVTDLDKEKWHDGPIIFSEDPTHFIEEAKDMRRIRKLAHNANFLYCFALFEYYASKVVKITYKFGGQAENSPKKRYIHRFKEVGKKSSENRDHRYTDLFDSPQKMIEFYDELPETMNLWTFMLGINKKGLFKDHILRYTEARERRNLLIHRGIYVDERYKKTFIKAHSKPDKGKTAEKYLEDTFENFAIKEKGKKIDMTVLPKYFQEVFEMLMIMSSLLYIYSFKPSKEDIDSGSLFPDSLLHDLMCFSDDIGNFNSLFRLSSVIFEYKENCANNDWKNVPALDKINLLIMFVRKLDELIYMQSQFSKKNREDKEILNSLKKLIPAQKEMINDLKKEIAPTIPKQMKLKWRLLENHIKGDVGDVIESSKKLNVDYDELNTWFMYRKYKKDKRFQKFSNSIKPKKENRKVRIVKA